jgi:putative glutamine amidotransferase
MLAPVVVGITLRPQRIEGTPPRHVQNSRYLEGLVAAGAVPLGIPPLGDAAALRTLYDRCDAVLLPGGPDVEPARYGQDTLEGGNVSTAPELDEAELRLVRWALDDAKPLLAICRGLQVLNVALGGTLWQDIEVQAAGMEGHHGNRRDVPAHSVAVVPGTLLHRVVGAEQLPWNSLHHQAVRELGAGLVVDAVAEDGLVEGVELPGRPVLAVQCHPEEMAGEAPWAAALLGWLVGAARSEPARL